MSTFPKAIPAWSYTVHYDNANDLDLTGAQGWQQDHKGIILRPKCEVCNSRGCKGHGESEIELKAYCDKIDSEGIKAKASSVRVLSSQERRELNAYLADADSNIASEASHIDHVGNKNPYESDEYNGPLIADADEFNPYYDAPDFLLPAGHGEKLLDPLEVESNELE